MTLKQRDSLLNNLKNVETLCSDLRNWILNEITSDEEFYIYHLGVLVEYAKMSLEGFQKRVQNEKKSERLEVV